MTKKLAIDIGGYTHVGGRDHNDDVFGFTSKVVAVSDGMGGHPDGDLAAKVAVDTFLKFFKRKGGPTQPRERVEAAFMEALVAVCLLGKSRAYHGSRKPGCTLVGALITRQNMAYIASMGDSRLTLINGVELRQITTDHNIPGAALAEGRLTREQARKHPASNTLLKCLGAGNESEAPDLFRVELAPGMKLVLTTDGVHGVLTDDELVKAQRGQGTAANRARLLVEAAIDADTSDNATCLVLRCT